MRWLILVLCCLGVSAVAEERTADGVVEPYSVRMPGTVLLQLERDPTRFLAEAAAVILGYGAQARIGPAGLEDAVRTARAQARARALKELLAADLDNSFSVDARELSVVASAASASMRGQILGWHIAADRDRDGLASFDELRVWSELRALEQVPDQEAAAIRGLMKFDADGDGYVSIAEVQRAVRLLSNPA